MIKRSICSLICLFVAFGPLQVFAQAGGLSFSITPTIFDMAAMPGQSWSSTLKVVNNNPYELTLFASVVNFQPQGERGHGAFFPVEPGDAEGRTLAEWMTVPADALVIPKESSLNVPVQIQVPGDATPGGHYAAIMIGTQPPDENGELQIKTSQIITALFFVRLAGDVVELGEVRTFRPLTRFAGSPEVSFELRFENKGTVHIQPQGEIRITNMWGKERGIIPVNRETNFGNVLPDSQRLFEFTWRGEASLLDIGRYKADVTLAYGQDTRKFVTRSAAFWVIPLQPVLIFLISFAAITWLITRSVRAYVRYMLRLSGIDPDAAGAPRAPSRHVLNEGDVRIQRRVGVNAPVAVGYADLRTRLKGVTEWLAVLKVFVNFVRAYPVFFSSVFGFVVMFIALWWYLSSVTIEQRDYEVTIDSTTNPVTISSEEILYERNQSAAEPTTVTSDVASSTEQVFELRVVNASATPGTGGVVADVLTAAGYQVAALTAELGAPKSTSVIVFDPALEAEALALSDALGGWLLSAFADGTAELPVITLFVGDDYVPN